MRGVRPDETDSMPLDRSKLKKPGMPGARWLVLWIAAAVTAVVGVIFQHLVPNLLPIGKGFVPTPLLLLRQSPFGLIAIGALGILVGAAGIAGSPWRVPVTAADDQGTLRRTSGVRTTGGADAAAYSGLIVASAALAAVILIQFVWPAVVHTAGAGPCGSSPTVACFSDHPDFYQELPPGSGHFTTPWSRLYDGILTAVFLAALPLALAAAVTSVIALASRTRRPGVAVIGVALGSITVVVMATMDLAFFLVGGD